MKTACLFWTLIRFFLFSVLFLALCFFALPTYAWIKMYNLRHADHAAILAACREVIDKRESYPNNNDALDKGDILILPPLPKAIPSAIRELNPRCLIINSNYYVIIVLNPPFPRVALIGFKPGFKQFGTIKYVDGLWF